MHLKRLAVLFCFCSISFFVNGQLVVQNDLTPEQLINDVLLGEGVDAENITFNGASASFISSQFGTFDAANSNIGLGHGIILATGGVSVAESPNDLPTAHVLVPETDEYTTEPDLAQIMAPAELNDVATVEFDFTAHGDTLRFNYVFASEEYNEHTCSPYNDAFGFFISGPGITGNSTYEHNARNVALVPGKDVPVAINTVNQGFAGQFGANSVCNSESADWQENSVFFVNNEGNDDINATQFDGFTVPMRIEIPVVCGGTYHIKMAIADATDGKNDSAVFIEAGSFSSQAPLEADLSVLNPDTSGNALEGCSSYRLKLSRSDSMSTKTIYLRTAGLENSETIFANMPDSVTFYYLDGVKTIDFDVADDATFEGLRNFNLEILQPEVCSVDTAVLSLESTLSDSPDLELSYADSTALSCDETGQVSVGVTGGHEPYAIAWNDSDISGFNFSSAPENSQTYSGVVSDFCDVHQKNVQLTVYRETYDSIQVSVPPEVSYNCADPVDILPQVSGGFGEYEYSWLQNDVVLSNELELNQILTNEAPLHISISDRCMPSVDYEIAVASQVNPLHVSLGPDTSASCIDPTVIVPEVYGGFGSVSYVWKINNLPASSAPTFSAVLSQTSSVSLQISDACGQSASDQVIVAVDHANLKLDLPTDTAICESERLILKPKVSGGYGDYTYFWNDVEIPDGIYSVIPKRDVTYNFSVVDACGSQLERAVNVKLRTVLADFEFDYENNRIVNHSTANCWYSWNFPDGSSSNEINPTIKPDLLSTGNTFLNVQNDIGCEAEAKKFFNPPFRIFIPTAFTPDGDGVNEIFRAKAMFISSFKLMVFDRWGKMVFQSDDISKGWNGRVNNTGQAVIDDVYSYRYVATDFNGRVHEKIGSVRLMR